MDFDFEIEALETIQWNWNNGSENLMKEALTQYLNNTQLGLGVLISSNFINAYWRKANQILGKIGSFIAKKNNSCASLFRMKQSIIVCHMSHPLSLLIVYN